MKFNKAYKHYEKLFTEGIAVGVPMEGEQVAFVKNWEKDPYIQDIVNTSTGERIRAMIDQKDDPLIATGVQYKHPHAYGSFGSPPTNNEKEVFVTVSRQYALGLYADTVTVPASIVTTVENGINMPKLSDKQNKKYEQNYKGEEPKVNTAFDDPTKQTHASWKDQGITPTS